MKVNKILSGVLIILLQVMTFAPLQTQAAVSFERVGDSNTCTTQVQNFISDASETDLVTGLAVVEAITDSRHTASIPGAIWVWPTSQTIDAKNGESQTIVRDFVIMGNPMGGSMNIAADNTYRVYINDTLIGEDDDSAIDPSTYGFDEVPYNFTADGQDSYAVPASVLVTGTNTLRIEATNWSSSFTNPLVNPAGILYSMDITSQECESVCQVTVTSDSATTAHGTGAGAVLAYTDSRHTAVIDNADWIWSTSETLDAKNGEDQSFTRTFAVDGDTITSAVLDIASDNSYEVIINGTLFGGDNTAYNFTSEGQDTWDISSLVTTGVNTITFEVRNWSSSFADPKANPAALMYSLVVTTEAASLDCETQNHPPVIVVIGDNPLVLTQDDLFTDPGAIANDFEDGDITADILVGGDIVDTSIPGTYTITYSVSDSQGLAAEQKTRVVIVEPKETQVCSIEFISEPGTTYVDSLTGPAAVAAWDQNAAWTAEEVIDTATWIWKTERTADARNGETVDFYRTVTIPGTLITAQAEVGADNRYKLFVNDTQVSSDSIFADYSNFTAANVGIFDITSNMTSGDNNLHFYVRQNSSSFDSTTVNPAGLIYRVQALYETTEDCEVVPTDLRPEITVNPETVTITVGGAYNILTDVTADDFEDGDITVDITTGGDAFDPNTVGTYVITYDVTDSDGNDAVQKTRTINVVPPVSETGTLTQCIILLDEAGNVITNPDNGEDFRTAVTKDGNTVNVDVTTPMTLNTDLYGDSTVDGYCVSVTASAGNHTYSELRAIDDSANVIDYFKNLAAFTAPKYFESASSTVDLGDFAVYGTDADSDGTITIAPGAETRLNVLVQIAEMQQGEIPVITVNPETITLTVGADAPDIKNSVQAVDNEDGVITPDLVTGGDTVDTNTIGSYVVTYDVTDSDGNDAVQKTRTYIIQPSNNGGENPPVLTLVGDNPLVIYVGNDYVDPGATADDIEDGDITADIVVGGDTVTTNQIASFTVTYDVTDSDGNTATQVTRQVEVRSVGGGCSGNCYGTSSSNTKPVIVLEGANPLQLVRGQAFTEPGYIANDNEDGVITSDVVIGGDVVDTDTVGTYTITYNVNDSQGLAADQVSRVVVVGEILGATNLNCEVYFTEWLQVGDRNDEVRKVQAWLNEFLALDIKVDGIYGPETAAAVGYFQSRDSYAPIVLDPWNYDEPTYRWYKTTRMLANRLHGCPEGGKFLEDVGRTWQTTDGFTGWVDAQ